MVQTNIEVLSFSPDTKMYPIARAEWKYACYERMMAHNDLFIKRNYAGLLLIRNFTRTVVIYRSR